MAAGTVNVRGLRELQRDCNKISKSLGKEIRGELRDVGNIVRDDARARLSGLSARSASGLRTRVRQGSVSVEQSRRRTTGKRPDWGRLQMDRILEPALADKSAEVEKRLGHMIDRLAGQNGW